MSQASNFGWRELLTEWSQELLNSPKYLETLTYHISDYGHNIDDLATLKSSGWLGYPGATEEQIKRAENRLGIRLPTSYREFLKVSNGWRTLTDAIYKLWSVEEADWFAAKNQAWIDAYNPDSNDPIPISDEEYFIYGKGQSAINIRTQYLQTALELSEDINGEIYLLNPKIVTADGEWEAWFFANWLPGARRYRSFWELMQAQHESFISTL